MKDMKLIVRLLNSRYSVGTFLWAIVSLILGLIVAQIAFAGTPNAFVDALPFDGQLWSVLLTLSSLAAIVGMAKDTERRILVRVGSFASFCLWIFGTISFASSGVVFIPIISAPLLIVFAYIYLASLIREKRQL